MTATCPNDANHKKFVTVAHVTEDWIVDSSGEFLDVVRGPLEVVHGPDVGNIWECYECGAEAVVNV